MTWNPCHFSQNNLKLLGMNGWNIGKKENFQNMSQSGLKKLSQNLSGKATIMSERQ